MYELRPESIRTFVTDQTIVLPRFQRKSTWSAKQNFNLALSIFRGFPIGVFVIKKDSQKGKAVRYLLDGRQRRNALRLMEDPEAIYDWAKAAIKIRSTATPDEIETAFSTYLETYLGVEEWETQSSTPQAEAAFLESALGAVGDFDLAEYPQEAEQDEPVAADVDDDAEADDGSSPEVEVAPIESGGDVSGLLKTILLSHPRRGRSSGFTRIFDFRKYVGGLQFVRPNEADGKLYIDSRQLLNWLEYAKKTHQTNEFPTAPDQFADWILEGAHLLPNRTEPALRNEIKLRWSRISGAFEVLRRLDDLFQEGVIGYLEIRDASPNDERKIFEIINTAGTPLTAAEILSARPAWNEPVLDPHKRLADDVKRLYDRMGIDSAQGVVRWDVPATLMDRLHAPLLFGDLEGGDPRSFERKLTLGFKVLAGYYADGLTKDDIAALPTTAGAKIPWSTSEFDDLASMCSSALLEVSPLKFWNSWNLSVIAATSDAVALNYFLVTLRDWIRKGSPMATASGAFKKFARNATVLLDRSVFEYVNGDWRGSSDSRLKANLAGMAAWDLADPVSEERWSELVASVIDKGSVKDQKYTNRVDPRIVALLYYRNVVLKRLGPANQAERVHVDHIVPRVQFDAEGVPAIKANMHHISNLALLPQKENQQKSGHLLSEVTDPYLMARIAVFEDIPETDFDLYSSSKDSEALRAFRGELIRSDLTIKRSSMLTAAL